ncbi:hypothetical protein CIPAW_05G197000 [Carya illinoinensis]|uniref:Uncharacterized protein n=1 Tax=Carya illinoinensis TaxID=32201 RepID=A0A8T1QL81_CARIL|nr:hypothetical protein CIPAW_05G197000 [Carya illinoinensis]
MMIEDLQRQAIELNWHLAVQDIGDCEMEDQDSDSSFENPYHNCALFWKYHGREERHGNLDFKVDLLEFPSTLQAEGFVDLLHEIEWIYYFEEEEFENRHSFIGWNSIPVYDIYPDEDNLVDEVTKFIENIEILENENGCEV